MMVLTCSFASVKMRELNGCKQELRGVFEYAQLHHNNIAWKGALHGGTENP